MTLSDIIHGTPRRPERDSAIIERLLVSDVGKAAAAELDADVLAKRKAAVARIDQARRDIESKGPPLSEAAAVAEKKLRTAEKSLETARTAYGAARMALAELSYSAQRTIAEAESELRASASPQIAELRAELRQALEVLRRTPRAQVLVETFNVWGKRSIPRTENAPDDRPKLMAAIQAGLRQCDDLAHAALTSEELTKALKAIRQRVATPAWLLDTPAEAAE